MVNLRPNAIPPLRLPSLPKGITDENLRRTYEQWKNSVESTASDLARRLAALSLPEGSEGLIKSVRLLRVKLDVLEEKIEKISLWRGEAKNAPLRSNLRVLLRGQKYRIYEAPYRWGDDPQTVLRGIRQFVTRQIETAPNIIITNIPLFRDRFQKLSKDPSGQRFRVSTFHVIFVSKEGYQIEWKRQKGKNEFLFTAPESKDHTRIQEIQEFLSCS